MRRPLGTGLPLLLTGNGTSDVVYDLRSASSALQSRVNLLTLYAIAPYGATPSGTLELEWADASSSQLIDSFLFTTDLQNYQGSSRAARKVLDRFPLRGACAIEANFSAAPADQTVYLVGYVELEGSYDPPQPVRPFQTSASFVPPYTYTPAVAAGGSSLTFHEMEDGYIDELTLTILATGVGSPHLVINDGANSVSINLANTGASGNEGVLLLDGIPVQAQGSSAALSLTTSNPADSIVAWGSFSRR